jgi:hypothetical protein
MLEVMKKSMDGIKGLTGTTKTQGNGIVKDVQMSIPAGANPQLAQSLSQFKETMKSACMPLPVEPVGVGARWEYKTRVKGQQGITIDQTATYQLVSINQDQLELKITMVQNAASQKNAP